MNETEEIFTRIFDQNSWKGTVKSGPGSALHITDLIRPALSEAFSDLGIRSLCDAPCGDGTWVFSRSRQVWTDISVPTSSRS